MKPARPRNFKRVFPLNRDFREFKINVEHIESNKASTIQAIIGNI
jgi:hypothetical protein